jgi:phosphopantetheinyl transferase
MHNAVWTLKESVGMAQGKLISSGPEDMAQLTKKLYNELKGQGHTIPDSPEGARAALKQMVIRLNETRQAIQGVQ